jgi:hypothetical protein
MKNKFKSYSYVLAAIAFASVTFYSCAPASSEDEPAEKPTNSRSYQISENDVENIALATDYLSSLISGEGDVTRKFVNESFIAYGPAYGDSATIDQVVAQWAANATTRTNQKAGVFISNSLTVTEGSFAGDWVSMWGNYTGTDTKSGMEITVPWHSVTKIVDGKIAVNNTWFDNLAPSMKLGVVVPAQ